MIGTGEDKMIIAVPHMRIRYKMKRKNLERIYEILLAAKEKKSRLVILPTLFHLGPVLDSIGEIDPRKHFKRSYAEKIPGATTEILRHYSEKIGIPILAGPIIERAGPRLYSTSILIIPGKGVVAKYRKIALNPLDLGLISSGNDLGVIDVGIMIGVMCEEDLLAPEIAHALTIAGSEIIVSFMRLNEEFRNYRNLLIARSIENSVPVIGVGGIISSNSHDYFEVPTIIVDPKEGVKEEMKGFEETIFFLQVEKRGIPKRDVRRDIATIKKVYLWLKRKKLLGMEV
ncbi:MAG: carbon-nitrogen hydrolase family protein [Desulfurococcales archaeon]|jgi:predicted amidohydrolase|nr:carbon-nitrogen hydrolase family protein [Desulfurococcales archaeon]